MRRKLLIQTVFIASFATIACAVVASGAPGQRVDVLLNWFVGVFGPTMLTRKLAKALAPPDQWLAISPLLTGAVTSMSALTLLR